MFATKLVWALSVSSEVYYLCEIFGLLLFICLSVILLLRVKK